MPVLLDLFCGAGGAAMGYHMAGFTVIGVDIKVQIHYPFGFIHYDALKFLKDFDLSDFSAIHASPPCQGYSTMSKLRPDIKHPKLIAMTRRAIKRYAPDVPYVIENVEGAKNELIDPIMLCGSAFGLRVQRHRFFESNTGIKGAKCQHRWQDEDKRYLVFNGRADNGVIKSGTVPVHGANHIHGGSHPGVRVPPEGKMLFFKSVAMGIDWMTNEEINESIPPAYARHLGQQLRRTVRGC
jgi:DNA (cytosine-5)-methyltransferase 1